ncbi:hypothetical protein D3C85_1345240 [compost metagenome]
MAAGGPVLEPVGPIHLILVEQVGKAFGQLVALAQVAVVGEKALQGLEVRFVDDFRQQAHQTPGQWRLVEQRHLGDFFAAQHLAVQLPHETAG